jgi:hypothetical protein
MKKGEKMSEEQRRKTSISLMGHSISKETREKIRKTLLGRKPPKKAIEKNRERCGEKSHRWKGDLVGYHGVHKWIYKILGRPNFCEHCLSTDISKRYEWANKDHSYKRNVNDYMRLCQSCHVKYDKLMNQKYAKNN